MESRQHRPGYRAFDRDDRPGVREFYTLNHREQTLGFVLAKKAEYLPLRRRRMSVWQAVESLDAIADESDPDLQLSQLQHALQTAEALRADRRPRWMIVAGFIHDLGKVLCLYGEPQWAVVGDTFPVGCAFSQAIVHPELFAANPDMQDAALASRTGIYEEGCGLDRVHLSWGHDEYLYHVMRDHLCPEALDIIRYHSLYAVHRERAYAHLLAPGDDARLDVVRDFNAYDLYSKVDEPLDWASLRPYYEDLIAEFLPTTLQW